MIIVALAAVGVLFLPWAPAPILAAAVMLAATASIKDFRSAGAPIAALVAMAAVVLAVNFARPHLVETLGLMRGAVVAGVLLLAAVVVFRPSSDEEPGRAWPFVLAATAATVIGGHLLGRFGPVPWGLDTIVLLPRIDLLITPFLAITIIVVSAEWVLRGPPARLLAAWAGPLRVVALGGALTGVAFMPAQGDWRAFAAGAVVGTFLGLAAHWSGSWMPAAAGGVALVSGLVARTLELVS